MIVDITFSNIKKNTRRKNSLSEKMFFTKCGGVITSLWLLSSNICLTRPCTIYQAPKQSITTLPSKPTHLSPKNGIKRKSKRKNVSTAQFKVLSKKKSFLDKTKFLLPKLSENPIASMLTENEKSKTSSILS